MSFDLSNKPAELPVLKDEMPETAASAVIPPTRIGGTVFLLMVAILVFWGGLGSWAALAPIQGAVVASGKFKVEDNLPVVQHLEGGIVEQVMVREGDRVHAGDALLKLEDTYSVAQDMMLVNQLVNALAQDLRIAAELKGAASMVPTPELSDLMRTYPSFRESFDAQQDLLRTNNAMWLGQVEILTERLDELNDQLAGLEARYKTQVIRLDLVRDELGGMEDLYAKGLVTKTRLMQRRDAEAALAGDLGVSESQIAGLKNRISETRIRMLQVDRDRASALSEQRQQIKALLFDIRQRIVASADVKRRLVIRAPADGRVLGLQFTAPGEVIQDGEEILRIVPDGVRYVVEGQIRPEDVDQVTEGSTARVRLTAYNFRTTPPVEGEVIYVSADSFVDPQTDRPYFTVHVRIPDESLDQLPGVDVSPGMPAQVMIATREQTVADYIIGPISAGLDTAARETD